MLIAEYSVLNATRNLFHLFHRPLLINCFLSVLPPCITTPHLPTTFLQCWSQFKLMRGSHLTPQTCLSRQKDCRSQGRALVMLQSDGVQSQRPCPRVYQSTKPSMLLATNRRKVRVAKINISFASGKKNGCVYLFNFVSQKSNSNFIITI